MGQLIQFFIVVSLLTESIGTGRYLSCAPTYFKCSDGICIPPVWLCDGIRDCLLGEDETCPLGVAGVIRNGIYKKVHKRDSEPSDLEDKTKLEESALKLIHEEKLRAESGYPTTIVPSFVSKRIIKKRQNDIEDSVNDEEFPYYDSIGGSNSSTESDIQIIMTESTPLITELSQTMLMNTETVTPSTSQDPDSSTLTTMFEMETTDSQTTTVDEMTPEFKNPEIIEVDEPELNVPASEITVPAQENLEELLQKIATIAEDLMEVKDLLKNQINSTEDESSRCLTPKPTTESPPPKDHPTEVSKVTCPNYFQDMNGLCINVQVFPPVTWFEAFSICSNRHGHLVIVDSKQFFENLLKQLNFDKMRTYDFWIGATNSNEKRVWSWFNEKPIHSFDIWGYNVLRGNPELYFSYGKPHQCGFLDGRFFSYINEASCHVQKGFICQYAKKEQNVYY